MLAGRQLDGMTGSLGQRATVKQPTLTRRKRYYWKAFIGGAVLYYIANKALALSRNINLIPTVILLGSRLSEHS